MLQEFARTGGPLPQHTAEILWSRGSEKFVDNCYPRAHVWRFDGGLEIPASSSPHVVPLPYSDASAVDPEEAFVAALSSCHMLWLLNLAAAAGFCVDRYLDRASGEMGADAGGRIFMKRVRLAPEIEFSGARTPTPAELDALHHAAHERCFLANSVKTEVICEPVTPRATTKA